MQIVSVANVMDVRLVEEQIHFESLLQTIQDRCTRRTIARNVERVVRLISRMHHVLEEAGSGCVEGGRPSDKGVPPLPDQRSRCDSAAESAGPVRREERSARSTLGIPKVPSLLRTRAT